MFVVVTVQLVLHEEDEDEDEDRGHDDSSDDDDHGSSKKLWKQTERDQETAQRFKYSSFKPDAERKLESGKSI